MCATLSVLLAVLACRASAVNFGRSGLHDPLGAVQGLIGRVLGPQYIPAFELVVIPADPETGRDVFEIDRFAGLVVIRGNAGYSISAGLNWWLKYTANCSVSWGRNGSGNQVALPPPSQLPLPVNRWVALRLPVARSLCLVPARASVQHARRV